MMEIRKSGEDYLEAILILERQSGAVRSIDLARHMGYSKASISHATSALRKGGFLVIDKDGCLHMTDKGREIAERIYERHQFFYDAVDHCGRRPGNRRIRGLPD